MVGAVRTALVAAIAALYVVLVSCACTLLVRHHTICEDVSLTWTDSHPSDIQRRIVSVDGATCQINFAYLGCVVDTCRTGFAEAGVCRYLSLSLNLVTDSRMEGDLTS